MMLPAPITSRTNPRVKALRGAFLAKSPQPGDVIAIEGVTLMAEAASAGIHFEAVFVRESSQTIASSAAMGAVQAREWVVLNDDAFDSAVDTVSPQGIAATFVIPEVKAVALPEVPGLFLVLEAIQDPGNLGTLLRSAEAFGVVRVFVVGGTASPWNPKTMRASAGSVFRMGVVRIGWDELAAGMRGSGVKLVATVVGDARAKEIGATDLKVACALLIGNEGVGLSAEAVLHADELVYVPCATESLNAAVAGSVVLYEAARQRAGVVADLSASVAKGLA